ncbi:6-phosphogluconate dehydrogenase C-terminal domain-like protein [Westerdykella ornata]|uniref:6-phosphogluconate dehydrogenase C-terminal domain-like protein n=1 Tax=Westerdykella ornata TaxID=318751 RepID=A0A6A6JID5_WESOR|nr:6-phosphogluconate dehydrogenase C-terminal domain-like protein [Westerdykella ornata]KAF2275974.1 6-phosphogluconate dehydrogenase C-terminal domain-like protein [Westerdykella ornata]
MTSPRATVGILSIGQMGAGIAELLLAHGYRVVTNATDRSLATQTRAKDKSIILLASDTDLVAHCDYIFSIVPPRDAVATASRIGKALNTSPAPRKASATPLYFLELNAVSPQTSKSIAEKLGEEVPDLRFIDGGIIGGPPTLGKTFESQWIKPGIPLSGPYPLHEAPVSGAHLAETLNTRYLGPEIGSASGLKCCFAALAKGLTALALQSFSTAASLNVLPALEHYLDQYNPQASERVRRGIVGCPSKAYRWVEEMNQIGQCFSEDGGWEGRANVFREIAEVYEELAKVVERRGTEQMGSVDGVVGALLTRVERQRERRKSWEELEVDEG